MAMNPQPTATSTKKAFWLRWPFLVTVIPLMLLLLAAIALGLNEWRAASRVQAELARIQAAGYPIDDASMSRWFLAQSSQEGTSQWRQVLSLVTAGSLGFEIEKLPYLGNAPLPAEIEPGSPWKSEPAVTEYLQWMRPAINDLYAATEYPTPVWQPIEFRGFGTLLEELQDSRTLVRLLSLDVEHALYHGDGARALRSLQAMQGVAAAFDWQICIVADIVTIASLQSHQRMVQRSLSVAPWNEEQLQLLQDQFSHPREVSRRWQNVVAGERAMVLSAFTPQLLAQDHHGITQLEWLWRVPSLRETTLAAYHDFELIGVPGLSGLDERASVFEQTWLSSGPQQIFSVFTHLILPASRGYADAIEREEMSRRLTLTAIAVKRFQLSTGQWPERLDQLEQVGLKPVDWHTVSAGQFGYEVSDDAAYLWSFAHGKELAVPEKRPAIPDSNSSQPTTPLVVIR